MYLTITPNTALDRVILIDAFQPETVMRTTRPVTSIGGKGLDTSVVLRALGQDTLALGFIAGLVGEQLTVLLEKYGIEHDLVWVGGETRLAHVIVERAHQRHAHIITGSLETEPAHHQALLAKVAAHLPRARWLIAGGSLPATAPSDLYRWIIEAGQEVGVPALIDSSGPPLLAAADSRPAILKMNQRELRATYNLPDGDLSGLPAQIKALGLDPGPASYVITCGKAGIVAVTRQGSWLARAPIQEVVNAAGAGDAVSAALVWRLSLGDAWEEALRWAAAISAAVVLTPGTADCHRDDMERILPQVEVRNLTD